MYAPGHTYPEVTPDALSSFSYNVPIVGSRAIATPGHVSMRLNSAQVLTLATPADAERCVFARDEPAKGKTRFATVRTTDCRAISAPTKGWHTRMSACPACGKEVRPLWPSCRACGALLMAAPAPLAPVGASVGASNGPRTVGGGAVLRARGATGPCQRRARRTRPPRTPIARRIAGSGAGMGKWITLIAMVVFVISAVGAAMFVLKPSATAAHQTPEVLAPRRADRGSADQPRLHRARFRRSRRGAPRSRRWSRSAAAISANSRTCSRTTSGSRATRRRATRTSSPLRQNAGSVTIAVAASNHDVCAFGQWTPDGAVRYVTMAHETACAAVNAPSIGWSSEPGGAASDLPDNIG